MESKLHKILRAIDIYRREGIKSLLRKGLHNFRGKRHWFFNNELPSGQRMLELRIMDTTARFDAEIKRGGNKVRLRHETERKQLEDLVSNLRDDDIFYDIGACIGTHTCFAANRILNGKVIAVEPYSPNVEQLERNISHNYGNVAVYNVALSNFTGHMEFVEPDKSTVGYGSASILPYSAETKHRVKTYQGDQFIAEKELPHPTVVKIDVEGAEPLVIEGLKKTLESDKCRLVYCEIHLPREDGTRPSIEDFGSSPELLQGALENLSFETEILDQTESDIHLKGSKKK